MNFSQNCAKNVMKFLEDSKRICHADAATLYLESLDRKSLRFFMRTRHDELPVHEIPLFDIDGIEPNCFHLSTYVYHCESAVRIDDVYSEKRFDLSGTQEFDSRTGYFTKSIIAVPIIEECGRSAGVLQLMNVKDRACDEIISFSDDDQRYLERIACKIGLELFVKSPSLPSSVVISSRTGWSV